MKTFIKDPDAVLDYGIDWSDKDAATNAIGDNGWLQGDTIASSVWTVPAGITKDSDSFNDTSAIAWLSGGVIGKRYELANTVTTAGGRTEDRSISILVRSK